MTRTGRDSEAGITLIEMLVVIAVIGVATGAAVMGLGNRGSSAESEAVRLARHLNLAVDEALIGGLPLSFQWDSDGYSFSQMLVGVSDIDPPAWGPATSVVLSERYDFSGSVKMWQRDVPAPLPVVMPASLVATKVTFEIEEADQIWLVTYDGFNAIALLDERQ